jgi:hypothetical protein
LPAHHITVALGCAGRSVVPEQLRTIPFGKAYIISCCPVGRLSSWTSFRDARRRANEPQIATFRFGYVYSVIAFARGDRSDRRFRAEQNWHSLLAILSIDPSIDLTRSKATLASSIVGSAIEFAPCRSYRQLAALSTPPNWA